MPRIRLPYVLIAVSGAITMQAATAATFSVTNLGDSGAGSFRAQIAAANGAGGPDTITFDVTGTINIDTPIDITDDLVIDGPGISSLTLNSRVTANFDALFLDSGARSDLTLEIRDLSMVQDVASTKRLIRADNQGSITVANAVLRGNGVEILNSSGGAIAAEGTDVTLQDTEISNFNTTYRGAGVLVRATGSESADLVADNCLFENNVVSGGSGDTTAGRNGGAIAAEQTAPTASADITVRDSTFIGNSAPVYGGAIYSNDDITVDGGYFFQNSAPDGSGAAIYTETTAGLTTLSNSVLIGNIAADTGGGVCAVVRDVIITNTTFSANEADRGGALFHSIIGTVDIVNSTFSGNAADITGGAMHIDPTGPGATDLNLLNVTITGNTAASGGGIVNDLDYTTITAVNTVIAGNSAGTGPEVAGAARASYSHIGDSAGDTTGATITELTPGSNIFNTGPSLGPLADNGGQHAGRNGATPMRTHAVLINSVLIGAGDITASFSPLALPATDQRGAGFERIRNGGLEIGAVEYSPGAGSDGGGGLDPASILLLALCAGLACLRGTKIRE